jgi:N6-adenosine-specific RNA methylase IME4
MITDGGAGPVETPLGGLAVRPFATVLAGGPFATVLAGGPFATVLADGPFGTVLADPPWRFQNRTGKVAPEHVRLSRYDTMTTAEIAGLPVAEAMAAQSHCYLWVPNALLAEGLAVLSAWGFTYKSVIIWAKRRSDGGPDGRGVGFYFRNVTEPLLFGVHPPPRSHAGQHDRDPEAGAQPQARRAVPVDHVVLPRPLPRAVRPLSPGGMVGVGPRGTFGCGAQGPFPPRLPTPGDGVTPSDEHRYVRRGDEDRGPEQHPGVTSPGEHRTGHRSARHDHEADDRGHTGSP